MELNTRKAQIDLLLIIDKHFVNKWQSWGLQLHFTINRPIVVLLCSKNTLRPAGTSSFPIAPVIEIPSREGTKGSVFVSLLP